MIRITVLKIQHLCLLCCLLSFSFLCHKVRASTAPYSLIVRFKQNYLAKIKSKSSLATNLLSYKSVDDFEKQAILEELNDKKGKYFIDLKKANSQLRQSKLKSSVKYLSRKAKITKYGLDRVYRLDTNCKSESELKKLVQKLNNYNAFEKVQINHTVRINSFSLPAKDKYFISKGGHWKRSYDELWGVKKIKAPKVWEAGFTGKGVVVAVLDTGLDYNHPDIFENLWINPLVMNDRNQDGKIDVHDADLNSNNQIDADEIVDDLLGKDFYNLDNDPFDDHSHGTHVAGTIAAVANDIGVIGVAPEAKVLPLKFLDAFGGGSEFDSIEAMLFLQDLLLEGAIDKLITNNSWGAVDVATNSSTIIKDAFDALTELGAVHVAAAGNENSPTHGIIPGGFDSVITVGAGDVNNNLANFSNYSRSVDIVAPGAALADEENRNDSGVLSLLSSCCTDNSLETFEGQYIVYSGTSMAAPHVAGSIALLMEAYPQKEVENFKTSMKRTSTIVNSKYKLGGGYLDVYQALLDMAKNANLSLDILRNEGVFDIYGIASSNTLESWKLSYSTANSDPVTIVKSKLPVSNKRILFNNFDSRNFFNDTLRFKLSMKDQTTGVKTASEYFTVNLENFSVGVISDLDVLEDGSYVNLIDNNQIKFLIFLNRYEGPVTATFTKVDEPKDSKSIFLDSDDSIVDLDDLDLQPGAYNLDLSVKFNNKIFHQREYSIVKESTVRYTPLSIAISNNEAFSNRLDLSENSIRSYISNGKEKLIGLDFHGQGYIFYDPLLRNGHSLEVKFDANSNYKIGHYDNDSIEDMMLLVNPNFENGYMLWFNESGILHRSDLGQDWYETHSLYDLNHDGVDEVILIKSFFDDFSSKIFHIIVLDAGGEILLDKSISKKLERNKDWTLQSLLIMDLEEDGVIDFVLNFTNAIDSFTYINNTINPRETKFLGNIALNSPMFEFGSSTSDKKYILSYSSDSLLIFDNNLNLVKSKKITDDGNQIVSLSISSELDPLITVQLKTRQGKTKLIVLDSNLQNLFSDSIDEFAQFSNILLGDYNSDGVKDDLLYCINKSFGTTKLMSYSLSSKKELDWTPLILKTQSIPILLELDYDKDNKANIMLVDFGLFGDLELNQ